MDILEETDEFGENYFEKSCGNVFADLGLSNPEERLKKAEEEIFQKRILLGKGFKIEMSRPTICGEANP